MQIYDWILNFGSFGWVVFGILFIIPSIFGIYEANEDKDRFIYSDYTDVLLVIVFALLPFAFAFFVASSEPNSLSGQEYNATKLAQEGLESSSDMGFESFLLNIIIFIMGILLIVKAIYFNKNSNFLSLYSAICAKFFFPFLIVVVFIAYKILSAEPTRPERKKYKTSDEYQAALARYKVDYEDWKDKKTRNAFLLTGATTALILMMHKLTKKKQFVGLKEYMDFKGDKSKA